MRVPALTSTEARVLDSLDEAEAVAALAELVAVPSVGGSPAEAEIQHLLAARLAALGLEVDLWPLDLAALRADPGYPGEEVDRAEAWGLVASTPDTPDPGVIVQGHTDVVPPGDRAAWADDPYEPVLLGADLHGRGACDMKGGLAAILVAVAALHRSGVTPDGGFAVHCVAGEEDGGIGTFGTLARGHRGRACIIPEPTSCTPVTANAGALTFRIEVPGRATHGSTPYAGSSAIDSYWPIHAALADLARTRNTDPEPLLADLPVPYPLSVGTLRAGDWASSVPDRLVAEGRLGLRVDEDPAAARAELEGAVAAAAERDRYLSAHPPVVSWPGGQFRGARLPPGHPLLDLIGQAHAEVTGAPARPARGVPYGSDLRLYAAAGVPTLHYGPGDVRLAHGPQESVPVAEVLTVAATLALALLRVPAQSRAW